MIKEILQIGEAGLGNEKTADQKGYVYQDSITPRNFHETYKPLAQALYQHYQNVSSVLELGSGCGSLCYHYKTFNVAVKYVTIDINKDIPCFPFPNELHFIAFTDKPFQLVEENENGDMTPVTFDTVYSFEHFEHIDPDKIMVLLNNIKTHCHAGTIVVATAANHVRDSHPTVWARQKWVQVIESCGFEMLNKTILNKNNLPFHIKLAESHELIFSLKETK